MLLSPRQIEPAHLPLLDRPLELQYRELVHKKRTSADELVWIFHERMRESAGSECPVTLAIVPDAKVGWRVILTKFTQNHRPETVADISKWERALRKQYALLAD